MKLKSNEIETNYYYNLFCILNSTFAQEFNENDKKFKFGPFISESYSLFDGATLSPGLYFKYNRHSVLISWKIYQRDDSYYIQYDYADYMPIDKRYGMDMQYGFSLVEFKKRYNLNLVSELNWTSIDRKYENVGMTLVGGNTVYGVHTRTQNYISIMIGYGIDVRIVGNLYATHSFSYGLGSFKENDSFDIVSQSYNVFSDTDGYGTNVEFSIKTRLGLVSCQL